MSLPESRRRALFNWLRPGEETLTDAVEEDVVGRSAVSMETLALRRGCVRVGSPSASSTSAVVLENEDSFSSWLLLDRSLSSARGWSSDGGRS